MRKLFYSGLLLIFCLLAERASAQEVLAPDYRAIKASIQNTKGPNYYPQLMRRYLANDTTLTLNQYRALYYGYSLQEDYVPYQQVREALFDARQKLVNTKGAHEACTDAIKLSQAALDDNPFDLLAISTMAFSYLQLRDTTSYRVWTDKQNALLDAIISSGDGEDKASAIHVINIEDEYEVLNRLGLQIEKDSLCSDQVEYLKVLPNADDIPGVYFNFGACRSVYRRKYE